MSPYEYEVQCENCGLTFTIYLSHPAEAIAEASLGDMVTALHPKPLCEVKP